MVGDCFMIQRWDKNRHNHQKNHLADEVVYSYGLFVV